MVDFLRRTHLLLLVIYPPIVNAQSDTWLEADIAKYYSGYVYDIDYCTSGNLFSVIGVPPAAPTVFRSTDGGISWEASSSGIGVPASLPGGNFLVCNPAGHTFVIGTSGLLRSTDGGDTWEEIWDGSSPNTVAVDATGNLFFSHFQNGISTLLKSTDEGATWLQSGSGLPAEPIVLIAPSFFAGSSEDMYVRVGFSSTVPNMMFRSTNNGETFTSIAVDPLGEVVVSPLTGSVFGTDSPGVFRSRDRGDSWEVVAGTDQTDLFGQIVTGGNGYIYAARSNIANDVWISFDDGAHWSISTLLGRVTAMDVQTDGGILAGTEDAGIFRSTDFGNNWTSLSDGLPGASNSVTTIAVDRRGTGFAQGAFGTYKSADQGLTWIRTVEEPFSEIVGAFLTHPNGDLFAYQSGFLLRSTDSGASWTELSPAGPAVAIERNGNILSSSQAGIMRSTDLGLTWHYLRPCNSPFEECIGGGPIGAVDSIILARWQYWDERYGVYRYGYYLSVDNGSTWQSQTSPELKSFTGSSTGRLFLATTTGLLKSDDQATTWLPVDGLGTTNTSSLVVSAAGEIYAGTATLGVYRSTDDGETWSALNTGMSELRINTLFMDDFGVLYAATPSGIFRTMQSTMPTSGIVDRDAISFGSGGFGLAAVDSFKVVNTGVSPLVVAPLGANDLFLVSPSVATIPVGDSLFVRISFLRDSLGSFSESVLLGSNSTVPLNVVSVSGATTGALLGAGGPINFGTIAGVRKDSLITISNAGYQDSLVITRVESSGSSFQFLHPAIPVPPGQEQVDTIAFIPVSLGLHIDTLLLFSNSFVSPDTIVVYGVKVADQTEGETPDSYYLLQNFPNPFNASTTISFGLPVPGRVVLSLHSLLGETMTLVEGDFPAGNFEYRFQPETLSTGLYFYRISTGSFLQARKMLLLR